MLPCWSPKTQLALGKVQPPSAFWNSRTSWARIMSRMPRDVSRCGSQMGMRFSATSSPRRTPIAMEVTTGPKCVRRNVSVRGSPPLTWMVSVRTSMSRHWPSRRYWFGWFGSVLRTKRSAWSAPRAVRPQATFGVKPIRMFGLPATPRPRALKVLPLRWNSYHSDGLRTGVCGSLISTVEPVVVFLPPMTQAWLNLGPGGTSVAGTSTFRIRLCPVA